MEHKIVEGFIRENYDGQYITDGKDCFVDGRHKTKLSNGDYVVMVVLKDFNGNSVLPDKPKELEPENVCIHCGGDKQIRNPKGYCDHLYYPDYCDRCKELLNKKPPKKVELPEKITEKCMQESSYPFTYERFLAVKINEILNYLKAKESV